MKTIPEMTKEIVATFESYKKTGTAEWTHEIAAKDLSYQLGSLTRALMQLKGERFADGKTPEELKKQVADELADILAEVLFIAHELEIDIGESWEKMIDSDNTKIKNRS